MLHLAPTSLVILRDDRRIKQCLIQWWIFKPRCNSENIQEDMDRRLRYLSVISWLKICWNVLNHGEYMRILNFPKKCQSTLTCSHLHLSIRHSTGTGLPDTQLPTIEFVDARILSEKTVFLKHLNHQQLVDDQLIIKHSTDICWFIAWHFLNHP